MTTEEVIKFITLREPIDEMELEDPELVDTIVNSSLTAMNRYCPNKILIRVNNGPFYLNPDEVYLESYPQRDLYTADLGHPADAVVMEDGGIYIYEPCFVRYQKLWTLQNIPPGEYEKVFKDIASKYAKMYVSNKRRTVTMEGLPFDLKGDTFYNEAKDELNDYLEKLRARETGF